MILYDLIVCIKIEMFFMVINAEGLKWKLFYLHKICIFNCRFVQIKSKITMVWLIIQFFNVGSFKILKSINLTPWPYSLVLAFKNPTLPDTNNQFWNNKKEKELTNENWKQMKLFFLLWVPALTRNLLCFEMFWFYYNHLWD